MIFVCGEVPTFSGNLDEFLLTKEMAEEMVLELEPEFQAQGNDCSNLNGQPRSHSKTRPDSSLLSVVSFQVGGKLKR